MISVTANSSGVAWFVVAPATGTWAIIYDNSATASATNFGTYTNDTYNPSANASGPYYSSDYRVVSAGLRCWLTTPYINSTG